MYKRTSEVSTVDLGHNGISALRLASPCKGQMGSNVHVVLLLLNRGCTVSAAARGTFITIHNECIPTSKGNVLFIYCLRYAFLRSCNEGNAFVHCYCGHTCTVLLEITSSITRSRNSVWEISLPVPSPMRMLFIFSLNSLQFSLNTRMRYAQGLISASTKIFAE